MTEKFTAYLVDDDPGVFKALSRLLRAKGHDVKSYSSPQVFLEEHDLAVPGGAVLDDSMPGLDGLEIQRVLTVASGYHRPVVFVTGKGDIPTAESRRDRLPDQARRTRICSKPYPVRKPGTTSLAGFIPRWNRCRRRSAT